MPEEMVLEETDYLSSLNEEARLQLVNSVVQDYTQWKQSRMQLESKWRECWEAYLCDVQSLYTQPDEATADRSRIARPVLYEAVEAIHSNLLNALFPANERFFTVMGKTETDHQNARVIEEFLRSKLEEIGFFEKYALFLKQGIITGNTVAAVPWRRKTIKRRVNQPVTLFGVTVGFQKATVDELVYNGPEFEVIDIFDFLVDPDEPDFEKAKVIRRLERNISDLKANPAYRNLEDLQGKYARLAADDSNRLSRRRAFGIEDSSLDRTSARKNQVTLLEVWGDFRIGEKLYENYVCVVANNERVIRFEPNPYDYGLKPFIFTNFIPVPNESYGIGAIEKSLGLQHAINTLTNQKLDVINLSINNPFTYLINDDVFDPETLVTRPGALIPVKSHETLRPIQYLNNFTVAFNEIADLKSEIEEATGAFKYFTGADNTMASAKTATEVSALVSGGTQKFSYFLSHLENTSLEPFLRIVFENAKQFLREPESLRVSCIDGTLEFLEILPELLRESNCAFRIDGGKGSLLKGQEVNALISFIEILQGDPETRSKVNVLELYKKVYRRLGLKDETEVFNSEVK